MSLGSDYATGINLGLNTREQNEVNPVELLNVLNQAHWPMGGLISVPKSKSSEQILADSKQRAYELKKQDLDLKEKELQMRETVLNNASTRSLQATQEEGLRTQTEGLRTQLGRQGVAEAETRATTARGLATADKTERKGQLFQDAIRGFHTGDTQAVKRYFDIGGTEGISIEDIKKNEDGTLDVYFGEGRRATFDSPTDAIEKLLMPAQLIEQGIKGRMTEKEKAETGIQKQKADAYTKSVEDLGKQRSGEVTEKDREKQTDMLYKEYISSQLKLGATPEELMDRNEFAESIGLSTGKGVTSVTEDELMKDLKNHGFTDEAARDYIEKAKAKGKI